LFSQKIFGVLETTTVLQEMYKAYFFKEQRAVFAPWRVLRAMDLSSVGGLNYNGLKTLRQVEELEKYERGVLPSRHRCRGWLMTSIHSDSSIFLFTGIGPI